MRLHFQMLLMRFIKFRLNFARFHQFRLNFAKDFPENFAKIPVTCDMVHACEKGLTINVYQQTF